MGYSDSGRTMCNGMGGGVLRKNLAFMNVQSVLLLVAVAVLVLIALRIMLGKRGASCSCDSCPLSSTCRSNCRASNAATDV